MTGWDILDKIVTNFSPIAAMVFLLAAGVIFAIGFFRHGTNFIKYGFKQKEVDDLSKKIDGLDICLTDKIDGLDTRLTDKIDGLRGEFHTEINGLRGEFHTEINGLCGEFHTELAAIKVNHFGHLKNFLTELTSILLDKKVINNQDKARLDNQLRGM